MASGESMELIPISGAGGQSPVTTPTENVEIQRSLLNELTDFRVGQAQRVAELVRDGADPNHVYYDVDSSDRATVTPLRALLCSDSFCDSDLSREIGAKSKASRRRQPHTICAIHPVVLCSPTSSR